MHPQPMNRGIEIASDVADGRQSVIRDQVRNGVAVRMGGAGRCDWLETQRDLKTPVASRNRGTIFLEDAIVLQQTAYDGDQVVLRVQGTEVRRARGSRKLRSSDLRTPAIPMRRPLSIMRAAADHGWIEILYKVLGPGLQAFGRTQGRRTDQHAGPDRQPFTPHPERPRALLIGGGVGIPPMIFLADRLRGRTDAEWQPLVLMGSEIPFPFRARPSRIVVAGIPDGSIACMPLLDEWGIASRLASRADFPGCFDGFVTQLADEWLGALSPAGLAEVEIFACGPTPMLQATAKLARRYAVPCQVSLEEFMACAVGVAPAARWPFKLRKGPP